MSDEKTDPGSASAIKPPAGTPMWLIGLLSVIGWVVVGGGGAYLGESSAQSDVEALEVKVDKRFDKMDEKMDGLSRNFHSLELAIARAGTIKKDD